MPVQFQGKSIRHVPYADVRNAERSKVVASATKNKNHTHTNVRILHYHPNKNHMNTNVRILHYHPNLYAKDVGAILVIVAFSAQCVKSFFAKEWALMDKFLDRHL
jgi:hypothetical protein